MDTLGQDTKNSAVLLKLRLLLMGMTSPVTKV